MGKKHFWVVLSPLLSISTISSSLAYAEHYHREGARTVIREEIAPMPSAEFTEVPMQVDRISERTLSQSELVRVFSNFKLKKIDDQNGSRLAVSGLIDPACAAHVQVKAFDPLNINSKGDYAIQILASDIRQHAQVETFDRACTVERAKNCKRNTCLDLQDLNVAQSLGVDSLLGFKLDQHGSVVIQTDDLSMSAGEDALKNEALTPVFGGPINIESLEEIWAKQAKEKEMKIKDEQKAICQEATTEGSFEALALLCDDPGLLGERTCKNISQATTEARAKTFAKEIEKAETPEQISTIIEEIQEAAGEHEIFKARATDLLITAIPARLEVLEQLEGSRMSSFQALKKKEDAAKAAWLLDQKNADLQVLYHKNRLERFMGQASHKDAFANATFTKEAGSAFQKVMQWNPKGGSTEVTALKEAYAKAFMNRALVGGSVDQTTGLYKRNEAQMMGVGTEFHQIAIDKMLEEQYWYYKNGIFNK